MLYFYLKSGLAMNLHLTKSSNESCSFKDVDKKQGVITGYFAAFNILDSDGDVIAKGAFSKTIGERGPQGNGSIKYLQDHDRYNVVGKLNSLVEDNYGLLYEGKVGRHTKGQDYLMMVEDGLITQHSFGYRTIQQSKKSDGNHLTELFMAEGSGLQVDAANPSTPILGVKSEADVLVLFEALEKALKTGTYSDECFKNTIIPKYDSIKSILPHLSTEPQIKGEEGKLIITNIFKIS
jgi:HK97 family phage prohead protease